MSESINSIKTIETNIRTLNDFLSEALKNGNISGYGEALKNQVAQLELLHKFEAEKPEEGKIQTYQTVFNFKIAESLVVDYGYFANLEKIEQNKRYPNRKVYVFRNTSELKADFDKLVDAGKKIKEQRNKENQEIDQAIKTS